MRIVSSTHAHTQFIRFVDRDVTPLEEAEHLLRKFVLPMFRRQRDKVSWNLRNRAYDPNNPDPLVDHIVLTHDGCDGFLNAVVKYVAEVCDVDPLNFDTFCKLAAAATGHDAFGQPNDLGLHFRAMKALYWRYIKMYHKLYDGQKVPPLFEESELPHDLVLPETRPHFWTGYEEHWFTKWFKSLVFGPQSKLGFTLGKYWSHVRFFFIMHKTVQASMRGTHLDHGFRKAFVGVNINPMDGIKACKSYHKLSEADKQLVTDPGFLERAVQDAMENETVTQSFCKREGLSDAATFYFIKKNGIDIPVNRDEQALKNRTFVNLSSHALRDQRLQHKELLLMQIEDKRANDVRMIERAMVRCSDGQQLFNHVVDGNMTFGSGNRSVTPRKLANLTPCLHVLEFLGKYVWKKNYTHKLGSRSDIHTLLDRLVQEEILRRSVRSIPAPTSTHSPTVVSIVPVPVQTPINVTVTPVQTPINATVTPVQTPIIQRKSTRTRSVARPLFHDERYM